MLFAQAFCSPNFRAKVWIIPRVKGTRHSKRLRTKRCPQPFLHLFINKSHNKISVTKHTFLQSYPSMIKASYAFCVGSVQGFIVSTCSEQILVLSSVVLVVIIKDTLSYLKYCIINYGRSQFACPSLLNKITNNGNQRN